jgi:uncharacterized protein YkwD
MLSSLQERRRFLQLAAAAMFVPSSVLLSAGESSAASLQAEAGRYLNDYRAKAGLGPLSPNARLTGAASVQCGIMIAHGKIGHAFGPGTSFSERMRRAGIAPGYRAENVARGQRDVAQVMQAWMNSRGHRRNMLHPRMSVFGIAQKDGYWALTLAG